MNPGLSQPAGNDTKHYRYRFRRESYTRGANYCGTQLLPASFKHDIAVQSLAAIFRAPQHGADLLQSVVAIPVRSRICLEAAPLQNRR